MNPLFDVPFLPDADYVDLLATHVDDLDCVHFTLLPEMHLDSRILLNGQRGSEAAVTQLERLPGVRKYALMNSRFYSPALLAGNNTLRTIVEALEELLERDLLDGVIYCDHYLLEALARYAPDIAASLEAVPGVNFMLDDFAKIDAQLAYIDLTGFQQPKKIVLDRCLNRDLDRLADVALKTHTHFPQLRIAVLANEGCLPHCPYKLAHDSYIALANIHGRQCNFGFQEKGGCMDIFDREPHRILLSPFIRPEDADLYFFHIDTIKLCGRTLGPVFLKRAVNAYLQRRYDGNLLDLLDTTNWLADRLHIDNSALSFDFANMLSLCDGRCEHCGFCKDLFSMVAKWQPLSIPDHRAALN